MDPIHDSEETPVRANYSDRALGIVPTQESLIAFLRNLILDKSYELRNRLLHIDYMPGAPVQSSESYGSKCNNCTLKCLTVKLQQNGYLARKNGRRDGYWGCVD